MTKNHSSLAIDPYYDGVPAYMTEVYDWAYGDPGGAESGAERRLPPD